MRGQRREHFLGTTHDPNGLTTPLGSTLLPRRHSRQVDFNRSTRRLGGLRWIKRFDKRNCCRNSRRTSRNAGCDYPRAARMVRRLTVAHVFPDVALQTIFFNLKLYRNRPSNESWSGRRKARLAALSLDLQPLDLQK
jgi:hypothetical protein